MVDPRDPDLGLGAMAVAEDLADTRISVELEIEGGMNELKLITILTVDLAGDTLEKILNLVKKYSMDMIRFKATK